MKQNGFRNVKEFVILMFDLNPLLVYSMSLSVVSICLKIGKPKEADVDSKGLLN